jgi:toxin ParE1/3/4
MPPLEFSIPALQGLVGIDAYTLKNWGESHADRYLAQLQESFARLLLNPKLGRQCERIRPGLRRMEQGKQVVFSRQADAGIRVSRILHQSMSLQIDQFSGNAE